MYMIDIIFQNFKNKRKSIYLLKKMCVTTIFRPDGGPEISHLQRIFNLKDSSIVEDHYYNMPKRSFEIIKCHHGCEKKNDNDAADLKACVGSHIYGCER